MLKYIWKSLKIDEIRSEIVRYGLQCSKKLEISKSEETSRKMKVVPTGSPGVENVPTPRESILTLSRGSQLPYTKKNKIRCFFTKKIYTFFLAYSTPAEYLVPTIWYLVLSSWYLAPTT